MISVASKTKAVSDDAQPFIDCSSYQAFINSSPLSGEQLLNTLFDRHSSLIQTRKQKFAVANLDKIFSATFAITAVSGFDKMSLRDLSRQTGMSMGAIYSCITKKEDIALMVADIVRLSTELIQQNAMQVESAWEQIKQSIRMQLYASTLLQPWYFFLYFETRSLPESQQAASKQIELDSIQRFQARIDAGVAADEFATDDSHAVANNIVVLLQDWYLKPWKSHSITRSKKTIRAQQTQIDNYYQSTLGLLNKLLLKTTDPS